MTKHLILKKENKQQKMSIQIDSHYESNDGFSTSVWGSAVWHLLHIISFGFPLSATVADKVRYFKFIAALRFVLPCGACRKNYKNNLVNVNFNWNSVNSRSSFSKLVYQLRQEVNTNINAGLLPWSYLKLNKIYTCLRTQKHPPKLILKVQPWSTVSEKPSFQFPTPPHTIKIKNVSTFRSCVWAPALWHTLHIISFNYPVKPSQTQKLHYCIFLQTLADVLPNKRLRRYFKHNVKYLDVCSEPFKGRHCLSRFIYNLRTQVDSTLKCTYYEIRHSYECFRAKCGKPQKDKVEQGCIVPKSFVKSKTILELKHVPIFAQIIISPDTMTLR
jgi:hypothetical protein